MASYLDMWTLQGEQVSISLPVDYQNPYVEARHVSRYGTAAVVLNYTQLIGGNNVEQRELWLVDLETGNVLSSTKLLDVQGLVPTGDGEGKFLIGTLSATDSTVSLQAYDLKPQSYDLTPDDVALQSPVKLASDPVTVSLSLSLLQTLATGNARVSVAQDVGVNLDYLLVNANGSTSVHEITKGQVGESLGSVNGWLNDYFVNGDKIWLSVWNGSQEQYLAFDPAATGTKTSSLSNQQFYDARELALDVGSVVRAGDLVVDLRALDIGIPADAAIWVDDERSVDLVNGDGLLIRAEIEPADWLEAGWSMNYEHWILVSATDGSLIAHRAFSSGAGLLMHSIDDADDGAIYFQQINATGSFPDLLQDVDQALSIHRIDVDSSTSSATLAALLNDSSLSTLADAPTGVDEVQAYSQAELSGSKYSATAPLPAEHLLVVEGYAPRTDGGSVAVGLIGDLNSDQDLGAFIAVSRPMTGSDPLVTSFVLPGEIIDSYYDPSVLQDSILAMVQSPSGSFAVSVDLTTPGVAVIDEALFAALAYQDDINNSEDVVTLELVFNDQSSLSLVIDSSELVSKLDVPDDTLDIVALTGKPLVVASSSDFVLAQFDYLDVNGVAGTLLARLDQVSNAWVVSDAKVVPGQIAEYWSEFSSNGLDAVGLTLIDVDNSLQISSVRVESAAITTKPIPTPELNDDLSTLNLSEYATVTASFGAEGEHITGTDGTKTFNTAIVLRTYDPATPANQSAVEYRSLMFAVTEDANENVVSVIQVGDTLGLRSLPSYQQSGIVGYEATGLFDATPDDVVFVGTDGSLVQATVDGATVTAGLAAIAPGVSTNVLAPRILEYNPETQNFVFALRQFSDATFTVPTDKTYLVRLHWDGTAGSALTHIDTLLLPTRFSGNFTGVRLVPSEHDGSLYFAVGQENGDQFSPMKAYEVDFGAGTVTKLTTASDFLAVQADYYGEAPDVRNGTEDDDSLYAAVGGEALDGLGGNDLLFGDDGNDTLIGGPGNDLLWGGAGVDALDGGEGWDTALFEDATARVVIDLTRSSQQVQNDGFGNVETLVSIENLNGSDFDDIITLALDGSSVLGRSGDDELNGAAGRQIFIGGSGNDSINGGGGDADRVSYFDDGYDSAGAATKGVAVDLSMDIGNGMVMAVANDNWGFTDTLTGIEEVQGSALDDTISGDSMANRLDGGLGDDFLRGRGGDDRLSGGGGSDYMVGGDGTDRIRYFNPQELAGDDIIGTNKFYSGEGTPDGGDATSNDRIQLIGPGLYDFATASSVSYIDRVDINADSGQFDVRLTSAMAASADANNDGTYGDIRVVGWGGTDGMSPTQAQLFLNASALTTGQTLVVTGQDGSGVPEPNDFGGLQGNDLIIGGAGNDWINAGLGNDALVFTGGNDLMWGDAGRDAFVMLGRSGTVTIGDFNVGEDVLDLSLLLADLHADQMLDQVALTRSVDVSGTHLSLTVGTASQLDILLQGVSAEMVPLQLTPTTQGWRDTVTDELDAVGTGRYELGFVEQDGGFALAGGQSDEVSVSIHTRSGVALSGVDTTLNFSSLSGLTLKLLSAAQGDTAQTLNFEVWLDAPAGLDAFNLELAAPTDVSLGNFILDSALATNDWLVASNAQTGSLDVGAASLGSSLSGTTRLGALSVVVADDHKGPLMLAATQILGDDTAQQGVLAFDQGSSNDAGRFMVAGLGSGLVDLQFLSQVDGAASKAITAMDALEALRLSVRLDTAFDDAHGLIAADFNQDGRVSARDALEILRHSVGLSTSSQPEWVFLDDGANLDHINHRNVDYDEGLVSATNAFGAPFNVTGVLLGDVNDSYSAYLLNSNTPV